MKLQELIQLCADEDTLLDIYDDESDERITITWSSDLDYMTSDKTRQREVQSYYHTMDSGNLVMEIYVK